MMLPDTDTSATTTIHSKKTQKRSKKKKERPMSLVRLCSFGLLCAVVLVVTLLFVLAEKDKLMRQQSRPSWAQDWSTTTTTTTKQHSSRAENRMLDRKLSQQQYPKTTTTTTIAASAAVQSSSNKVPRRFHERNDNPTEDEYQQEPGLKYLVGLMITDQPEYYDAMQAEIETWLKLLPRERQFVVGGNDQPKQLPPTFPRLVPSPCPDDTVWCKRVQHIAEAYRVLQEDKLDFDWLLSGNEDWYVHLPVVEHYLQTHWPHPQRDALVITQLGCNQFWEFTKKGQRGKPLPETWRWAPGRMGDIGGCRRLQTDGGICGGAGILFSKRAIQLMGADGPDALFQRTRQANFSWPTRPKGDPVLTCLVYSYVDAGKDLVKLAPMPWRTATNIMPQVHAYYNVTSAANGRRERPPLGTVHARVYGKAMRNLTNPASLLYLTHDLLLQDGRPKIRQDERTLLTTTLRGGEGQAQHDEAEADA